MRHGSLFSGIGGFDLAAQWMGWENVFHCEINPFSRRHLKYYWPNAISYEDITKTDFTVHRGRIDVISGGFPCQPFSLAGKRLGVEDERHLWPEMCRAIQEIQPTWVVGENVFGIVNWSNGLVFEQVCLDLETQGYEVQPYLLPASGTNAPHQRLRCFFVAYSHGIRQLRSDITNEKYTGKGGVNAFGDLEHGIRDGFITNSHNTSAEHSIQTGRDLSSSTSQQGNSGTGDAPNSEQSGLQGQHREREGCSKHRGDEGVFVGSEDKLNATNAKSGWSGGIREQSQETRSPESSQLFGGSSRVSDEYGDAADTNNQRLQGNELNGTFTEIEREKSLSRSTTSELHKVGNWEQFPTVSPICHGDDGISDRLDSITFPRWRQESIKGGGNAVVPQVILPIFKTIELYEKTTNTI